VHDNETELFYHYICEQINMYEKEVIEAVYTTINSEIDKIDTTMSTFVYLLLAVLHVLTPSLGHPQAYMNTATSCRINKYEFIFCLK
jgi:hypothetical protein